LHCAIKNNCIPFIIYLLLHRACSTTPNAEGLTPLEIAAKENNSYLARILLLNNYASPTYAPNGKTPLEIAGENGSLEVAKLLLSHSPPKKNKLTNIVRKAIENSNVEFVRLLLSNKSSSLLTNIDIKNLLHTVRNTFYYDLRQQGAILQILVNTSLDKNDLLLHAIGCDDYQLARIILECKTGPFSSIEELQNPLTHAIKYRHTSITKLLLSYKANPN